MSCCTWVSADCCDDHSCINEDTIRYATFLSMSYVRFAQAIPKMIPINDPFSVFLNRSSGISHHHLAPVIL